MAEASMVISVAPRKVRISVVPGERKVRCEFGDVTVFLMADDARELGKGLLDQSAQLVATRPEAAAA